MGRPKPMTSKISPTKSRVRRYDKGGKKKYSCGGKLKK